MALLLLYPLSADEYAVGIGRGGMVGYDVNMTSWVVTATSHVQEFLHIPELLQPQGLGDS